MPFAQGAEKPIQYQSHNSDEQSQIGNRQPEKRSDVRQKRLQKQAFYLV